MIKALPPLPHAGEYRKDGWPLCPRCGADELVSIIGPMREPLKQLTLKPKATDPMTCAYCHWHGQVPAKGKA